VLYAPGIDELRNGKVVRAGVEWTIKDGIPYSVPQLASEVREIVKRDRTKKNLVR
jgi:hypothetical protein